MRTFSTPAVSSLTCAACAEVMMTLSRPFKGRRWGGMLSHVLLPITTALTAEGAVGSREAVVEDGGLIVVVS